MTIEFTEFTAKPPTIKAIQVTAENVEELAVWLGADAYAVEKVLVGGRRNVVFLKGSDPRYPDHFNDRFVRTTIGDWIVEIPEGVDEYLRETGQRYWSVTQEKIDSFVAQQHKNSEIELDGGVT